MAKVTVQIFENGKALGEGTATVHDASTEQQAVDTIFKHVRIDRQYRFLGSNGFLIPSTAFQTGSDYLLFNGGKGLYQSGNSIVRPASHCSCPTESQLSIDCPVHHAGISAALSVVGL